MRKLPRDDLAILDAVASMTADIIDAPDKEDVKRLRILTASALRLQQKDKRKHLKPALPIMRLLPLDYDDDVREVMHPHLIEADSSYAEKAQVLEVHRRDARDLLIEGSLVDSLSGLSPSESLGPFIVIGGAEIWFDIFFATRRLVVIEAGATAPAIVLTKARPPVVGSEFTTIDIEPGTVWLRGDLIDGSLPADAFVGVKVSGGLVRLNGSVSVNGDSVEVGSSLLGTIQLEPAKDELAPVKHRHLSSRTKVNLPESLLFRFGSIPTSVEGTAGEAQAWGQTFSFVESTGSWSFVDFLWTVILEYKIELRKLNTNPISNDLVEFAGTASIKSGGLGLPVVVTTNHAILGEVANSPGWWLGVKNFTARWYEPDPRFHKINNALVGISSRGTVICSKHVPPLSPSVTHVYKMWSISDGGGQRVPWHQTYDQNFILFYRYDVVLGEHFLVSGRSTVSLDRPVQTNGVPIATPTTQGALLLHRIRKRISITIGAMISQDGVMQQLALRNALVWTTRPVLIFVGGNIKEPQCIDAGRVQLLYGVYAWAPILPDPYVTNFHIHRPDIGQNTHARMLLLAKISWRSPDNIRMSFQGQFGPPLALAGKEASPGDPIPAPSHQENSDIGPTQVSQNELSLDEETAVQWNRAREAELKNRDSRVKLAQDQNEKSQQAIDGLLTETLGPAPQVLLLDVSTNQDLLGVTFGHRTHVYKSTFENVSYLSTGAFLVTHLEVHSQVANIRVVTLPQVQWEPVRTLDPDQDIITLGWFPTPLASATDGGATQLGAYSQRLVPSIPEDALHGTYDAFSDGTQVVFRTTLPFGLVAVVQLQPEKVGSRSSDLYQLTQPEFPSKDSVGGLHITALAEGGRPDLGGVSPMFIGQMRQLINGVDLSSGTPLGLSVLGSTADPTGNVETIFNNDMITNPKVPVTRFDLSGYGGSNFSEWNNPFAAFAEAAKVQFRVIVGRTALEVIKVNSVLHPWGIRVTRSITVERRPGGGVIRRDSGWQAFTPGIFDYRYSDKTTHAIKVAPYTFDAGVFQGLFGVHSIRPAPGSEFSFGSATMVPYYFDAELALEGLASRTQAIGMLGYLQTEPSGDPASAAALQNLLETQGPIGGPIDTWIDFGGSGLPFRARRVEIGLALDGTNPIFVATVRGVPRLPQTGAWSVVTRPVASIPPDGGEAIPVPENRGVPLIRRYPIRYFAGNTNVYSAPPLDGPPSTAGDYRFADAADLLKPSAPDHDYALLQSTPTHAFLFPRPFVPSSSPSRIHSDVKAALADVIARTTSKSAFPPKQNTIELAAGSLYFDVGTGGTLALSSPISIVNHPTPLRIAGSDGHGSTLNYDDATLLLELNADQWSAEFTGLRIWTDICGLEQLTGSELRIVGSTNQRPQIAELKSLILREIEQILQYIPLFGTRGVQGPIDLGASNAKHEFKLEIMKMVTIPPNTVSVPVGPELKLKLYLKQSTGFDLESGGVKASATFGAELEGKIPIYSVAVVTVFLVVSFKIEFSLVSVTGTVTSEKLDLVAFVGIGVKGEIATFKAYAFLGIGFVLSYSIIEDITKYGGLVALEAGLDLKVVNIKLRAELQGLIYDDAGTTKCDYSGKVNIQVDIFLIISISATYQVTETATM